MKQSPEEFEATGYGYGFFQYWGDRELALGVEFTPYTCGLGVQADWNADHRVRVTVTLLILRFEASWSWCQADWVGPEA